MRYPPEYKAKARQKVVETAGALAKKQGFGTTGVDALMSAAGFTTGAFYSHFGSREALLKAIVDNELGKTVALFAGQDRAALERGIQRYLHLQHVDHPEAGCLLPSLTAEVARANDETRQSFEQQLTELVASVQDGLGDHVNAWAILTQMVGAVMLARALHSDEARKVVLSAAKESILSQLHSQDEPATNQGN